MRAVVFEDIGSVRVVDVPEPSLEDPHDAMVRVTVGAVCGSDLHAYHGTLPMDPGERLGHEAAGVVEQVGAAVSAFEPGDRVVIAFGNACRSTTLWRGSPLARAVCMYSEPSASIMLVRKTRAYQADPVRPSVTAGRTRLLKLP